MNKQFLFYLLVAILAWQLPYCVDADEKNTREGKALAEKYCVSCHQFPEPTLINKTTWYKFVLPKMARNFGYTFYMDAYVDDGKPAMPLQDWNNIVRYYLNTAPDSPLKREKDIGPIKKQTPLFSTFELSDRIEQPATTMVEIDSSHKKILFADGITEYLYTVDQNLAIIDSLKGKKGIANTRIKDEGWWMLSMGVLHPTDFKGGALDVSDKSFHKTSLLLDSLQRPVHAAYTDLNNDGLEDIILCEFGDQTGALSWFENTGSHQYRKHILRPLPGAIRTVVQDFNKDGKPDIMALMAQADEGLFMYFNQGNGTFREERLLKWPPSQGTNFFDVKDFNGDGFMDVIITNGDNGDYPPILKAYHGIRIYLNDGNNHFTEKLFLPVNGACKVIAEDFDKDGDLDLASISYFPDFRNNPEEGFIYWENKGNWKFEPSSVDKVSAGRWLTMDAGDIDGDGDIDIVLGNADFRLGDIPAALKEQWDKHSLSLLILKNNFHASKP